MKRFFTTFLTLLLVCFPMILRAAETDSVMTLSIAQAMEMATHNYVDVKIAKARTRIARARALQDAAALLPQVMGTMSQSRIFRMNLEAQGFASFPGLDPLIGPFNTFDARVHVVQPLFDMEALMRARSSASAPRIAQYQEQLAREQAAAAAALGYLETLRAMKAVETAQAGADLAKRFLQQSSDQHDAGAAAGIDVARARTRLAEENLRVLQAQSDVQDGSTKLKRILGIPLGQSLALSDVFGFSEPESSDLPKALALAAQQRSELRIAEESEREETLLVGTAKWAMAPALAARGDYGLSGNLPSNSHQTGSAGLELDLPLWTSGINRGRVQTARGQLEETQAQLADLRTQVEEDVRLAVDKLATSAQRVKTSEEAVRLAHSELEMARDRFASGVGENIDVVSAQTALARIQDAYIAALANYQATRINLAMALGNVSAFRFKP